MYIPCYFNHHSPVFLTTVNINCFPSAKRDQKTWLQWSLVSSSYSLRRNRRRRVLLLLLYWTSCTWLVRTLSSGGDDQEQPCANRRQIIIVFIVHGRDSRLCRACYLSLPTAAPGPLLLLEDIEWRAGGHLSGGKKCQLKSAVVLFSHWLFFYCQKKFVTRFKQLDLNMASNTKVSATTVVTKAAASFSYYHHAPSVFLFLPLLLLLQWLFGFLLLLFLREKVATLYLWNEGI